MPNQVLMTAQALDKLKKELDYLKNVRRKEVSEKISVAKERGDLSENAEYTEAREDQSFLEGKIAELEEKVKSAVIAENKNDDKVNLGCAVTVASEDNKEQSFTIVSFNEADPASGKISNESPLGSAFLGRSRGDEVDVELPSGVKRFKIVNIKG